MYLLASCQPSPAATPRRRGRRAVAAVELAVVLPFIITLILGMVEIGHGIAVRESLSDAAQKACRTAVQPGKTTAQAQAEVDNIMQDLNITGYTTTILLNGQQVEIQNAQHNDQISIKVSVPVSQIYWTTTIFLPAQDLESETVIMLRQG
jgi:Flp pilus assembly protein TadG